MWWLKETQQVERGTPFAASTVSLEGIHIKNGHLLPFKTPKFWLGPIPSVRIRNSIFVLRMTNRIKLRWRSIILIRFYDSFRNSLPYFEDYGQNPKIDYRFIHFFPFVDQLSALTATRGRHQLESVGSRTAHTNARRRFTQALLLLSQANGFLSKRTSVSGDVPEDPGCRLAHDGTNRDTEITDCANAPRTYQALLHDLTESVRGANYNQATNLVEQFWKVSA